MFVYFIPLTVILTKNIKLEKFVHELNALWKLSGSSLGALRELVTVAGIVKMTPVTVMKKVMMTTRLCYTTKISKK